ncbi:HAMP domain-containing sensor histidine kinase [Paenibacillus graminis]|uniref:HAMP domain-containing sensor histidine kinase n=1 Tax=Paenibacillus graminis TaxID=189425 RepID=UPI00138DEC0B|nr:HAMP domain-containing sensor histidine kinase [Paenibacillus graminis]
MLRIHYCLLVVMISIIGVLSIAYASEGSDRSYASTEMLVTRAQDLADAERDSAKMEVLVQNILKVHGWVELLDADKQVIHYIGTPLDQSTPEAQRLAEEPEHAPYISSEASFLRKGLLYIYTVKIPVDQLEVSIWDQQSARERDKQIQQYKVLAVLGFILLSTVVIIVYSRWTARKISHPLSTIARGINLLKTGDYTIRLNHKLEGEFLQIGNTLNDMAEKLEEAGALKVRMEKDRQRMLADIAHDLKTPISTLYGYAKALHEGMVKDEVKQQSYLLSIYTKAKRVDALLNTLFDMTQLDHPDYMPDKQVQDLGECMREAILDHFSEMEEKDIQLEVRIPDTEVSCAFDRKQMGRVFSNLLSNAVRYNPAGTRLRVSLETHADGLLLEFADNGIGIPEHLRSVIFDPFVRGDKARSNEGGTGLGLAIAYKIVSLHQGSLQLLGTAEECTIFRIRLPYF